MYLKTLEKWRKEIESLRGDFVKGRARHKWSIRYAGDVLGVSKGTVYTFEKGKTIPADTTLERIMRIVDQWNEQERRGLAPALTAEQERQKYNLSFNPGAGEFEFCPN